MAVTADQSNTLQASREYAPQVTSGTTVYRNTIAAIGTIKHATTASRGKALAFSAAKNLVWAGFTETQVTGGPTSASDTTPLKVAIARESGNGEYLLTVAGVANDATDVGQLVFNTDNYTFTLTHAALAMPFGKIVRYSGTSGKAFVAPLNAMDLAQYAHPGDRMYLGIVTLAGSTATTRKLITAPRHMSIQKLTGHMVTALNDSSTGCTVSLKIYNGTSAIAVGGGAITVATGTAVGARQSASAITSSNIIHEGEIIYVYVTPNTTAPTAGAIELDAMVLSRLGT